MVIGHQKILQFFKQSVENKRLSHAYLFTGPAHLGKKTVALEFIRMLIGQEINHAAQPDILIVEPEVVEKDGIKKELEISIDWTRKIQHQMSLFPYSAPFKIALIDRAEKMTVEAGNCLLKTLEEPSGQAILILITTNPQLILPTIVSRCQTVKFLPVAGEEIEKVLLNRNQGQPLNLKQIIRFANGRPGLVIRYLENPELLKHQNEVIGQLEELLKGNINDRYVYVEKMAKDISQTQQILNYWLCWFRDLLLMTVGCSDLAVCSELGRYQGVYSLAKLLKIIQTIKKTSRLLSNSSINARLALEVLMLEF